jgi:hypothetical protein
VSDAESPNGKDVKPSTLLLKEMDEVNNWARLSHQMYFTWFGLQFTINALAMSWLFSEKGLNPKFATPVLLMFVGWNLMGLVGTLVVRRGLLNCDQRIGLIMERLISYEGAAAPGLDARSPVPRSSIHVMFILCAITMLMSLSFWTILAVRSQAIAGQTTTSATPEAAPSSSPK